MGNLHLRFDEGRVGRATRVAFSPTLPTSFAAGRGCYPAPSLIVRDEYAPAIPRRVALQQSPSPFHRMRPVCYESSRRSRDFHRTANCVLTVCVSQPDKRNFALASLFVRAATNSRVPSLHRHYSASPLLRNPPATLSPVPDFPVLPGYTVPLSADFATGRGGLLQSLSASLPSCCRRNPAGVVSSLQSACDDP